MCNIQKGYLSHKAPLDLIAFMGVAWLVGSSTRLIQYFPKASKGGLFLSAGLAGTASYLYDYKFHDPDHHYLQTLLGKATAIALTTVCTGLAARSLKGRTDISFLSAARFGVVELVCAAIITKATQETSTPKPPERTPLQKEHRHYLKNPRSWIHLTEETRTEKAKEFMDGGLFALCLEHAKIDTIDFPHPQTEKAWEALTPAQLSWACQIRDPEANDESFLYVLCLKKGVEPVRFLFDQDDLSFFKGKAEETLLLYQDFVKHPYYYFAHDDREKLFGALFSGKDPIPQVEVNLNADQVVKMDYYLLALWGNYINENDLWSTVPLEIRSAFIKRTLLYVDTWDEESFSETLYVGVDSSWIAEMTLEEIQTLNGEQLLMYHSLMRANDPQLSPEQLNAFKLRFQLYDLEKPSVPNTDEEWERLSPQALELIRNKVNFSDLSPMQNFNLYKCCLNNGIDPYRLTINHEMRGYFKTQPEATNLLYQDFVKYPFYYYCHETEEQEAMMKELFEGRDPIPQVNAALRPEEIECMPFHLLGLWGNYLTREERWGEVSPESRSAFIKIIVYSVRDFHFSKELYAAPIDYTSLADVNSDEVAIMSEWQLEVYHGVMEANWGNLDPIGEELIGAFNGAFTKLEWGTF